MLHSKKSMANKINKIVEKSKSKNVTCVKHRREYLFECPDCATENEVNRRANKKRAELLNNAEIPRRFMSQNFDTFKAINPKAFNAFTLLKSFADKFKTLKNNGTSLLLSGNTGTGKTHLATSIMQYVINTFLVTAKYTTAYDFICEINETYRQNSSYSEREIKSKYSRFDLLVIDEFGIQRGRDNDHIHMFDLINKRYNELKNTIVISNLSINELNQTLGQRNISRLCQDGEYICFDWPDWRTK